MTTGQKIPTQAPLRSLDQRMEALRRANAVRVERARLKRELKAGDVSAREVLTRPPEYLMTAKVFDVSTATSAERCARKPNAAALMRATASVVAAGERVLTAKRSTRSP